MDNDDILIGLRALREKTLWQAKAIDSGRIPATVNILREEIAILDAAIGRIESYIDDGLEAKFYD